jgi:hypothetical protein
MAPKTKFKARPVLTPTGMLMFNHLTEASPRFPGGPSVYNFTLLMDDEKPLGVNASPAWKDMRAAIAEAIDFEWGTGKSQDAAFVKTLRLPIHDASVKSKYTGFVPGKCFINPWSKSAPFVCDRSKNEIINPAQIWAGQLVRAEVVFFPYGVSATSQGVSVLVNSVQIIKSDMPRMDGKRTSGSLFDDLPDDGTGATADADASPF